MTNGAPADLLTPTLTPNLATDPSASASPCPSPSPSPSPNPSPDPDRSYFEYTPGILRAWVEPDTHTRLVKPISKLTLTLTLPLPLTLTLP